LRVRRAEDNRRRRGRGDAISITCITDKAARVGAVVDYDAARTECRSGARGAMYFDRRLWELTRGLRGRIALAILIGLAAAAFGIARFALLGVLLARVFAGSGAAVIAALAVGVAGAVLLRALLDYARTVIAHHNAARVQEDLRGRLYDKIAQLGPAWFAGERTGGVMLSVVDGVEQLQSFFGQYLPQVAVAALTPLAIFAFIAWWDLPVATVMLLAALVTLVAPTAWNKIESHKGRVRQEAMKSFGSEFLDAVQGLPTLKAFGQSTAYGRRLAERARQLSDTTMRVLSTSVMTRGITDASVAIGAAAALSLGVWRVAHGVMTIEALLIVLMAGTEIFRPALGAAPGHGRAIGRRRHSRALGRRTAGAGRGGHFCASTFACEVWPRADDRVRRCAFRLSRRAAGGA
jgi:ATP-binding cassette subfamily C protein CydCD